MQSSLEKTKVLKESLEKSALESLRIQSELEQIPIVDFRVEPISAAAAHEIRAKRRELTGDTSPIGPIRHHYFKDHQQDHFCVDRNPSGLSMEGLGNFLPQDGSVQETRLVV